MKKAIILLLLLVVNIAFGCWYKTFNYEDYIYSINNRQIHTTAVSANSKKVTYTVRNNMVVDFPLSIAVKLISNESVVLEENGNNIYSTNGVTISKKQMLKRGKLQYRILPDGNWNTIKEFSIPTGTISSSYPPAFYFGRNNIYPKNCKAGDVIMIRIYITDGFWTSGDISSKCDKYEDEDCDLGDTIFNSITKKNVRTLKSEISFSPNDRTSDLGGQWTPCLVTTVIWSGKTRAVK